MNITNLIEQFKQKRILVIGEAMLDSYLQGNAHRLCREAPVPIVAVEKQSHAGGGAANTAVNIATLGAKCLYFSTIGSDEDGGKLIKVLKQTSISPEYIFIDSNRATLTKKRVMADGQLLVRFDTGDTHDLPADIEAKLVDKLIEVYPMVDGVIISDYGYGVLTDTVRETLKKLQKHFPKIIVADAKQLETYKDLHVDLVKPNYKEALQMLGIAKEAENGKRAEQILSFRDELFHLTGAKHIAVTLDKEGAVILGEDGSSYRTYAHPVEQAKAAGAGDTYISTFAIALASGADTKTAAELAATSTSIIVQKQGTAYCSNDELQQAMRSDMKFIGDTPQLTELISHYRNEGKRIVFTNGCFDILHSGHVTYLNKAKMLGDVVIVGVNSDASVKRLKGSTRPVNTASDRMQVLAALSSVDHVILFEEDTPTQLVEQIRPDVYVKGGDYKKHILPERPIVESYGGKVVILPFIQDKSTTQIIHAITAKKEATYA